MAISAWLRDVPGASAGQAATMTALGLLFTGLGLTLLTAVRPAASQARHQECENG
jgi:branched-subunit amino acid permease